MANTFSRSEAIGRRLLSIFLCVGFALAAVASESTTQSSYVVGVDDAQVFYHQNGTPTAIEEIPKGTEIKIESVAGERCFFEYKGKPAYVRMKSLESKGEFF